jgi:hypothetical protein
MTFGIPRTILPFDQNGVMDWNSFRNSIAQRKAIEQERKLAEISPTTMILSPMKFDVLLGRGRPNQEFPGNVRLAVIIDIHRRQYQSAKRGGKTGTCEEIVSLIKNSGGRFLKRQEGSHHSWVEVSDSVAVEKVSHGFRTKTKRNSVRVIMSEENTQGSSARSSPDNLMDISLSQGPTTQFDETHAEDEELKLRPRKTQR